MTDTNAKLAKAMGWTLDDTREQIPELGQYVNRRGKSFGARSFTTSRDAFDTHVLPELERRDLLEAWAEKVADLATPSPWNRGRYGGLAGITFTGLAACLSAPASVLCEAALAVMGGGDA